MLQRKSLEKWLNYYMIIGALRPETKFVIRRSIRLNTVDEITDYFEVVNKNNLLKLRIVTEVGKVTIKGIIYYYFAI